MDVIVKGVLSFIQQEKKNSVLAGGAARDAIFKVEPKDYDIFVPTQDRKDVSKIMNALVDEFGLSHLRNKTKEYGKTTVSTNLKNVNEFEIEGRKFDIIFVDEQDDEEFANNVVKTFDYGINMVYDDGNYLNDSNYLFTEDRAYGSMTLHNLKSMSHLPQMIDKFTRLNSKFGGGFIFKSTCLSLKNDLPKELPKKKSWATTGYTVELVNEPGFLAPPPIPVPWPDIQEAPQAAPIPNEVNLAGQFNQAVGAAPNFNDNF
jgi:hypothetical protein